MTTQTTSITDRIRDLAQAGEIALPPLPELGRKILGMTGEDSRATTESIARVVRLEPAISATVLKMANSVAFAGLHPITDLTQAIPRLGHAQVASIVTAMMHKGHFSHGAPERQRQLQSLWDHAVATAITARQISSMCGGDPDQAFLTGLLHDVGKLLVLKGVDHLQEGPEKVSVTPALLDELMSSLHAELGETILAAWRLPQAICLVARRHHEEQPDPEEALLIRVQAANAIAHKMLGQSAEDAEMRLNEVAAVEHLGLSEVELASLLVDLEDELADVKKLL